MKPLLILVAAIFLNNASQAKEKDFFDDQERGWFWREYIQKNDAVKKENKNGQSEQKSTDVLKKQGAELEESLSKAIIEPTQENIQDYIVKTKIVVDRASQFSKEYEQFLWVHPEFDATLESPYSTDAVIAKQEEKRKTQGKILKKISEDYGILFFFSSTCGVCQRFAHILKTFSSENEIAILPISLDGRPLLEFTDFKVNNNLVRTLNVTITPSLFLLNPKKNRITPLSFGYSDIDELKRKTIGAYEKISNDL